MEIEHIDVLIRLFIAHILADFFFQSKRMALEKKKGVLSLNFQAHIIIVGILTYILLGQWTNWLGPVIIMIVHGIIDATKAAIEKNEHLIKYEKWIFISDQTIHIFTIFFYWIITSQSVESLVEFKQLFNEKIFTNIDLLVISMSYLIITLPTGIFISFLTSKWQKEINKDDHYNGPGSHKIFLAGRESLKDAGKTIGIIERSLVLTFVLMQQYQAIGFLIAAKSVFRFNDIKEAGQRKRTEYILIGTFISFIIAIFCGIISKYVITVY